MSPASIARVSLILSVVVLMPGCRTGAPAASAQVSVAPSRQTSADVLARAEIQTARVNDAYEAVVRFRPEFLQRRAAPAVSDPSSAVPVVYVDGVRQGGAEVLRSIPATVVVEIRYLSATAASHQYGADYHAAGVLAVRTKP